MNTYNQAELNTLKLADITDLYNGYAITCKAKQVKKFRDKPTAVVRTLEMQDAALKVEWDKKIEADQIKAKAEDVARSSRTKRATDKKLTAKEHVAFNAIVSNGLDAMGGSEPADLLEDNMSWFDNADLIKATGFSKHQCAGLIASLEQKGFVVNSEEGINGEGPDQWSLTDAGINYAQQIKDEPVPEVDVKPAGNTGTRFDLEQKVTIVKGEPKEGTIEHTIFQAINEGLYTTAGEIVDYVIANHTRPRSDQKVDAQYAIHNIKWFTKKGHLQLS